MSKISIKGGYIWALDLAVIKASSFIIQWCFGLDFGGKLGDAAIRKARM